MQPNAWAYRYRKSIVSMKEIELKVPDTEPKAGVTQGDAEGSKVETVGQFDFVGAKAILTPDVFEQHAATLQNVHDGAHEVGDDVTIPPVIGEPEPVAGHDGHIVMNTGAEECLPALHQGGRQRIARVDLHRASAGAVVSEDAA